MASLEFLHFILSWAVETIEHLSIPKFGGKTIYAKIN